MHFYETIASFLLLLCYRIKGKLYNSHTSILSLNAAANCIILTSDSLIFSMKTQIFLLYLLYFLTKELKFLLHIFSCRYLFNILSKNRIFFCK